MKFRIVLLLVPILFCFSCNHTTQPSPLSSYEQWRGLNLHDYTIDQSRECYCIGAGVTVRLTIRADTIASVVKLTGTDTMFTQYYYTIDSLFGIIRHGGVDSLVVKYNTQYGYPEYLDIDPQLHPVDGGELYRTSNLQIP